MLCLSFLQGFVHAQTVNNRLTGIVSDTDRKPLAGVNISLLHAETGNSKQVTVSDSIGRYLFNGIAGGNYIVNASLVGFTTAGNDTLVIPGNTGNVLEHNIVMTESVSQLQAVP